MVNLVTNSFFKGLRLEDMFFVGVFEFFEQDLADLSSMMEWSSIRSIPTRVTRDCMEVESKIEKEYLGFSLSQKERDSVESIHWKDVELYTEARKLREMRVGS